MNRTCERCGERYYDDGLCVPCSSQPLSSIVATEEDLQKLEGTPDVDALLWAESQKTAAEAHARFTKATALEAVFRLSNELRASGLDELADAVDALRFHSDHQPK